MTGPELDALIKIIAIIGGVGGGLAALSMVMRYNLKRRELDGAATGDTSSGSLDAIRAELAETRGEIADLHERMDFAERLLTDAKRER